MKSALHPIIKNTRETIKSICEKDNLVYEKDYDLVTAFYRCMTDDDVDYWLTDVTVIHSEDLEKKLLEVGLNIDKYYYNEGNPSFHKSDRLGYLKDKVTGPDAPIMNVKMARYFCRYS